MALRLAAKLAIAVLQLVLCQAAAASTVPAPGTDLRRWSYQDWSAESGLPQISVNDVRRGPLNRLWIATENGLASFDGSEFEVYRRNRVDALRSNWITRLQFDQQGDLWIGTKRNLLRLHGDQFVHVELPESGAINALALGADGTLMVGSSALYRSRGGQAFEADARWSGPVAVLLSAADGYWVAAPSGKLMFLGEDGEREIAIDQELQIAALAVSPGDQMRPWVGANTGLYRVEGERLERIEVDDQLSEIQALAVDGHGTLWIGSRNRLLLRGADGRVQPVDESDSRAFPWVISLLADQDGMWLGSHQHGLRYTWPNRNQAYDVRDGLGSNQVWTMVVHREQLLIGNNAGIGRWNGVGLEPLLPAELLPRPMVYSLYSDSQERLWIGTRGGLALQSPEGELRRLEAIGEPQINGFAELDEVIWVATSAGLYAAEGGGFRLASLGPAKPAARALLVDREQRLWVGSQNGLYYRQGGEFLAVEEPQLSSAFITGLRHLDDGRMLVGTYDQGIALGVQGRWRWYDSSNGLLADTVFHLGVVEDQLWVSHPDGVYTVALATLGESAISPQPLLRDAGDHPKRSRLRCCNGAGQDKGLAFDNAYWLPSLGGVVRIPLDSQPDPPPQVALISTLGGPLEHQPLRLSGTPRDLDLRYAAIDFRFADQLRYRYRLRGYDEDWVPAGTRRQAIYTNLPPGEFTFEVQAQRLHGVWGPSNTAAVIAAPVLMETWYARLLLVLLALIVMAALLRWRMHRLSRQKMALEALVAERTDALAQANQRLSDLNRDLQAASVTDSLTGLHNRRELRSRIEPLLEQLSAQQESGQQQVMGLLLIDIDHFKRINDRHGHAVGDAVLMAVATAIRRCSQPGDLCLRWGGEEFLVIQPLVDPASLDAQADRLCAAIADCEVAPLRPGEVRACVGYLGCCGGAGGADPVSFKQWQKALTLADFALYAAKEAGRDRVATVIVADPAALKTERSLSNTQLKRLLTSGELSLQVRRWQSPD